MQINYYTSSSEDVAFIARALSRPAPQPGIDLDLRPAKVVVLRLSEDELTVDDVFIKSGYAYYDEILEENWWDNEYIRVSTGEKILVRNHG